MKKFTVSFKVEVQEGEAVNFEYFLKDLLETSTLPALSANLVPLSMQVKNSRN